VPTVDGRQLGGRREGQPVRTRGGACLGHAVDRVVVGQRDELDAVGGGARHHRGGGQHAVGVE
jgi:hypothetical protein